MLHRIQFRTSLATLSLLLASTAYAQKPVGANRPAGVPGGYVITPFGYFHPSCVLRLAEGEMLLDGGRVLQRADGALENVLPCGYPRFTPSGEMVDATGIEPPTISHAYVEYVTVTTTSSFGELKATWTVPPSPTANNGQTLYFFPGLEDINHVVSILQPVLGWNADFNGAWGIASWNCCPSGITVESSPLSISSGNKILGTIKDTCSAGTLSCSTWNVTTENMSTGHTTTLSNTPSVGQTFNWAFAGAMEVYSISKCSDYPSNASLTFSGIGLYDDKFNQIPDPAWSLTLGSGLTPQCGYAAQIAPTQVTLDYKKK